MFRRKPSGIIAETRRLVEENKRLEAENEQLKESLANCQAEVQRLLEMNIAYEMDARKELRNVTKRHE